MDPLSQLIALLRPHTAVSKPITGRGTWGVRYAAYGLPGFAIVLSGQCWLGIDGNAPVQLARGDFVLLPATPAFTLSSQPDADCVLRDPTDTAVRHGDQEGEPDFRMLGGAFRIETVNAPLLTALLPAMIHIHASEGGTERLGRIIELIIEECASDHPGKDMILQRLLEVMLVESLRWRRAGADALPAGLLRGMGDPVLARVLRALHGNVRAGWTVAELAKLAGMSRSAFAARFGWTLGCAPIEYLSRWRMALAQDALGRGGTSLDHLADEIGYESASAFSAAFRRRVGCSPGSFARARRAQAAVPAA
ncbi:AraC family transcriptional regulator [Phreatobacter stygius]|uniref:AraC family transcriptional regulator n=1 Tax=Phreatobacter stygius TaxID=1940610 RepID=A0A4D7BF96_9HYPH|nr:AraC family transcriptional regulator [Phreatobacter stygius]QCI68548.1 AraC family transcriptional regulator [Phreatobacter stygius]